MAFFSLSLSLPPQMIYQLLNNIQDVLKQPEANTDLLNFSALSYYKSSVEKISLYLLLHFRIRVIVLHVLITSLQEISRNHACLHCKITQITMMRGRYYFIWNLRSLSVWSCSCEDSRVLPLNLYYDISLADDLHCLKAVDRNFVRNGGTTYSSLCSWAGVSEEIANNVLFWLRLSKI